MELVSEIWSSRKKSNIIKWLMKQSGIQVEEMAEYLGCSVQYLNNKFTRDSFSIDDFIIAAYAAGYSVDLTSTLNDERKSTHIDIQEYFESYDDEVLGRIKAINNKRKENKRCEYEVLKAELNRMKEKYGFDD